MKQIKLKEQQVIVGKAIQLKLPASEFEISVTKTRTVRGFLYLTKNELKRYRIDQLYPFLIKSVLNDYVILSAQLSPSQKEETMRRWKQEHRADKVSHDLHERFGLKLNQIDQMIKLQNNEQRYEAFQRVVTGEQLLQRVEGVDPSLLPAIEDLIRREIHPRFQMTRRIVRLIIKEPDAIAHLNQLLVVLRSSDQKHFSIIYLGAQHYEFRLLQVATDFKEIRQRFSDLFTLIRSTLQGKTYLMEEVRHDS